MLTHTTLMASLPEFSSQIMQLIDELGLGGLDQCDHIALRVNSVETAIALKNELLHSGQIISDNMINGRPIYIIKLDSPLKVNQFNVDCIELPFPKNAYPEEGWEHIELVLPQAANTCEILQQQLLAVSPKLAAVFDGNSDISVKASAPSTDKERLANPTIAFKKAGVCVKVHPHRIEDIIASEQ